MTSSPQTKRLGRPSKIIDGHKHCPRCKKSKPIAEFRKRSGTKYTLAYCNDCQFAYNKAWKKRQDADPELKQRAEQNRKRYSLLRKETKGMMSFENVGVPMRIYPL